MNRRTFLERTAMIATVTYAGLKWTVPPPPEGGFLVLRSLADEIVDHYIDVEFKVSGPLWRITKHDDASPANPAG